MNGLCNIFGFKYPEKVRTLIYTTNSIENFNHNLLKVKIQESVFQIDDVLLKMFYLAMMEIKKVDKA